MTHTYTVTGMTCSGCEAKVKTALLMVPHVLSAEVSNQDNSAVIEMDKHIAIADFQKALSQKGEKYTITANHHNEVAEQAKSWLETYKPVLLIFVYITAVTVVIELVGNQYSWMRWMNNFMAGFFLVFSFFKLMDLKGFADSYAMYDIVAKRWKGWGYVYAFAELALALAFISGFRPLLTNATTFVLMSISLIGVLQSVLNKKKIRCACLGAVFNLPMSTVTIIEDGLMIAMSALMIFSMI